LQLKSHKNKQFHQNIEKKVAKRAKIQKKFVGLQNDN